MTPQELRPLLRELSREMGSVAAIRHWLTGCPPQPAPTGPHSRATQMADLKTLIRAPEARR
jgi:hypothetical protein